MGLNFEVKETDLLGRIGTLAVNGRRIETPCLFPVVHPVSQSVSIGEMRAIGFGALMTNSYILYKRRNEESLLRGIHDLLGFDGMVMTDSGGYQVLEYGDIDVSYAEIAEFQSRMGSDLAVTLDRPTGYSTSRRHAKETADYSTGNALATIREFGESDTVWVGPVQGGLFRDVLARSAKDLVDGGFRFLALGSPVQVMENYRYAELVGMIAAARGGMPFAVPLHLFGAGHPHTMAMSVALGCDTFDSASYILFARQGRYMTERGASLLKEMKYLPCSCPVCRGRSVRDMAEMEKNESTGLIAEHNLHLLKREVELCKEAISEGRLWDLVEERATSHPRLFEAFQTFASLSKKMERGTAPLKDRGLFVRGPMDERRPELGTARASLKDALGRSSKTALLVLSDERIPVGKLRFKRETAPRAACDIYSLHPQLGAYPIELDFMYPFTQTVASSPAAVGRGAEDGVRQLKKMGYASVLVARAGSSGLVALPKARSRPRSGAASPSPRSASARLRGPRHP